MGLRAIFKAGDEHQEGETIVLPRLICLDMRNFGIVNCTWSIEWLVYGVAKRDCDVESWNSSPRETLRSQSVSIDVL